MATSLAPYCQKNVWGDFLRKLSIIPDLSNISARTPHHPTALEIKNNISPKYWDEFYKFAFVRNPYDMEVSLYYYMRQKKSHRYHDLVSRMNSFDEYIEWRVNRNVVYQYDYITDQNGDMIVDFVGRFENMHHDFLSVCKHIGLCLELPKLNESKRNRNYRDIYSEYSQRLVKERFEKDLNFFNYEF